MVLGQQSLQNLAAGLVYHVINLEKPIVIPVGIGHFTILSGLRKGQEEVNMIGSSSLSTHFQQVLEIGLVHG